jgi:hypothetical protein
MITMSNKIGAILAFLLVLAMPAFAMTCTAYGADDAPAYSAISNPDLERFYETGVFQAAWTKCFANVTFSNIVLEANFTGTMQNYTMTAVGTSGQTTTYKYEGQMGTTSPVAWRYYAATDTGGADNKTAFYTDTMTRSLGGIDATWAGIIVLLGGIAVLCWAFFPLYGMIQKKKIDYRTVLMLVIGLMVAFALIGALLTI